MTRFMTGLLLGVGIGILFAPGKGADTRESLADSACQLRDQFDKLVGRSAKELEDLKGLLEHEIAGLSDELRNRIRNLVEEEEMRVNTSGGKGFHSEYRPM